MPEPPMPYVPSHIGDLASVAGFVLSLAGFTVTLLAVWRSKKAAQRAEHAAQRARETVAGMQTIVDLSSALAALDEVKRLHRVGGWHLLPERYSSLRRKLIALRAVRPELTDDQQTLLQSAISHTSELENSVEKSLAASKELNVPRLNKVVSDQIDKLTELLAQLQSEGVR